MKTDNTETILLAEKRIAELTAERDALQARVAELEKDAARYRWLRKTTNWVSSKGQRIDVRNQPECWDESIDAAMKETL